MTYRGDFGATEFRLALNRVSITFHRDEKVRLQVQELNEAINSGVRTSGVNRKIVRLIFDLCQNNGFKGVTQYDIDQTFPGQNQNPEGSDSVTAATQPAAPPPSAKTTEEKPKEQEHIEGEIVSPRKPDDEPPAPTPVRT
jgi:hypothetical protein